MKVKIKFFAVVLFCAFNKLYAQSDDVGIWIDLSASKRIKSASVAINGEFYTKENSQVVERTSIGLEGNYPLTSFLSFNSGYLLMNYNQSDYWEIRNRFFSSLVMKWRITNFVFSHRERIQLTRIPIPGMNVGNNLYWRNLFRAEFKNLTWKIIPSATIESFYSWGNTGTRTFDEFRYSLAAKYKLTKTQDIRIYGLWSDSVDKNVYVFGFEYEISI